MKKLYYYLGLVVAVYDGDTITVKMDLGFKISQEMKIRLYGIDTPEIRGEERPAGLIAKQYVIDKILNKEVMIQTIKDRTGKYGRYLGIVWYENADGKMVDLNQELINKGLAEEY